MTLTRKTLKTKAAMSPATTKAKAITKAEDRYQEGTGQVTEGLREAKGKVLALLRAA